MEKDTEPAFPCDFKNRPLQQGMTLRDYFAAKAMVAIIVESWEVDDEACQTAYKWADAMLKAREAK